MRTQSAVVDPKTSASGRLLFDVLERLQIAKEVAPKVKQFPSGSAALAAIGRGEARIGLEVTTAANGPDIELAGQLPSEVQRFNMYALGLSSRAQHAGATKAFAAFFLSSRGRAIVQEIGFQIPE